MLNSSTCFRRSRRAVPRSLAPHHLWSRVSTLQRCQSRACIPGVNRRSGWLPATQTLQSKQFVSAEGGAVSGHPSRPLDQAGSPWTPQRDKAGSALPRRAACFSSVNIVDTVFTLVPGDMRAPCQGLDQGCAPLIHQEPRIIRTRAGAEASTQHCRFSLHQ